MLSLTHHLAYAELFDGNYLNPATLDRAFELAGMAVHVDARLPQARAQLRNLLLYKRRHDAAIAEFERAFALNPNFIDHRYGMALIYAGEHSRAIDVMEASIRLDPFLCPQRLVKWAWRITCSNAMERRCACAANTHRARPICRRPIFF